MKRPCVEAGPLGILELSPSGESQCFAEGKKLSILGGYPQLRQATCSLVVSVSSRLKPNEAEEPGSTSFFLRVEW
jgi:hypothetical protein